jgi:murein DD-endopeptidase
VGILRILVVSAACIAAAPSGAASLPDGYQRPAPELRRFRLSHFALCLASRTFAQGEVVYLELVPNDASSFPAKAPVCHFGDYRVRLSRRPWGYRGFFPIAADSKPVKTLLTVAYPLAGTTLKSRAEVTVAASPFEISHQALKVGKFSDVNHAKAPEVQAFIARCSAKKRKAFAHHGPDLITSRLAHPRDKHTITSSFWSSRVYDRYKMEDGKRVDLPPRRKVHRGMDLRGAQGDPVFALADGEVVLADSTYYEGNFTIVDHGNRIMSYFMHQDSLLVTTGQRVRAGQQVGTVGSTGVSTAPHLHVSLKIDGIQVDPLSILPLPVRE